MVSFTPRHCRSAPTAPIQTAPARAAMPASSGIAISGGQPDRGRASPPTITPPSTMAPSPPITTRPSRAGTATQSAASSSGAARDRVLDQEKAVPKPAL